MIIRVSDDGAGMNVVQRNIENLGGSVGVTAVMGQGSEISLRIPLTLAIVEGLLATVDRNRYLINLSYIEECLDSSSVNREKGQDFISFRGSLVPILDLRRRFGLPDADHTGDSRFIVMALHWGEESISLGVLTDSVQGVIDLPPEVIGPPPTIGQGVESTFLCGTARYQDRILLLMDVDQILSPDLIHQGFAALSTRGPR